jgi:hypothetical protein
MRSPGGVFVEARKTRHLAGATPVVGKDVPNKRFLSIATEPL